MLHRIGIAPSPSYKEHTHDVIHSKSVDINIGTSVLEVPAKKRSGLLKSGPR